MKHLSIRVAWHDNKWNGTICNKPNENTFCTCLPRIASEKDTDIESSNAGKQWCNLPSGFLPTCVSECGAFMNKEMYNRTFTHNYASNKHNPHSVLLPTSIELPPYSFFGVPFWYMLKTNQKSLDNLYPSLPKDSAAPFPSAWIYGAERQREVLNMFFGQIEENKSLVVFYAKNGNPVDEDTRRLIVGIGEITHKSDLLEYDSTENYTYPFWDRLMTHSIRENLSESKGFLIPYHEYLELELPNEFKQNGKTKFDLLNDIKLTLDSVGSDQSIYDEFSYGCELINDCSMLSLLGQAKRIIETVIEHDIIGGNWNQQIKWINSQIGLIKEMMGPFPTFANALQAINIDYAHLMEHDLRENQLCKPKDNPWQIFEKLLNGEISIPNCSYKDYFPEYKQIWDVLPSPKKHLLFLLSRFQLSDKQIKKWYSHAQSQSILENPYILAEEDEGDSENYPISISTIDLGVFKDVSIQGIHIPTDPTIVLTEIDERRVRALIIAVLKKALLNGDTILSSKEIIEELNNVKLEREAKIPEGYIQAKKIFLEEKLVLYTQDIESIQLKLYDKIEKYLEKVLIARASKNISEINEDWRQLIKNSISNFDVNDIKHVQALDDQSNALKKLTERKLSILHGPAGTGKTTVMGALFNSKSIQSEGILLLAPTGKARVKLSEMAKSEAYTIAQFLTKQKRFDWSLMKPKFDGSDKYIGERNVIIDECSMLTEDDLYAVLNALDLSHIQRIILVGDPYQLPPIGAGRPFADLCNYLENLTLTDKNILAKDALARLSVVVRTTTVGISDTLTLASWFSGIKPPKNADEIFSRLGDNTKLNDLSIYTWKDTEELEQIIYNTCCPDFDQDKENSHNTFYKSIGLDDINHAKLNPNCIEQRQILSPVKNPFWGSYNINKIIQEAYNKEAIENKYNYINVGFQKIALKDKVIQLVNERKDSYPQNKEEQLSNGQIGFVHSIIKKNINIAFSGFPNSTFGYKGQSGDVESNSIELAYAITVHKSQGSDFNHVFLVLPKTGQILSRELIYTALTRAKDKLTILIEGESPHWIFNLSKSQYSATGKRNTNLFNLAVREEKLSVPYVEGLIHKTLKEDLYVRSKSEVIIANMLINEGVEFQYEKEFIYKGNKRIPDFSFVDAAGEHIILEHLGMLKIPSYKKDWNKKLLFYQEAGFIEHRNLFTTQDGENGEIDSVAISKVIEQIQELL